MPAVEPPDGWRAPATGGSAHDSVSDPGAPQHPQAATPLEFPGAPAGEVQAGSGGYGEAVATAPPAARRSVGRSFAHGLREVVETIILALLIFLVVQAMVQNFQVEGSSMEPTLQSNWYLLVNKAVYFEINLETVHKFLPFIDPGDDPTRYLFRAPHRGDIVVFKAPGEQRDFIKRIIGEPGEVVQIRGGTVFVDGRPLDEPYIREPPISDFGPVTVPPDCYFVLGDNRNGSKDSRIFEAVPKDNIIGQAWLTYWPFSAFGLVDNTSVEPGPDAVPARGTDASATPPVQACNR